MSMGFWAMSTHEPLIFKASESPQENEYVSKEGFGDRNTQSSTSSSDPVLLRVQDCTSSVLNHGHGTKKAVEKKTHCEFDMV